MKNRCFVIGKATLLLVICVFYSCKGKDDNAAILQEIDEGLMQSNKVIRFSSDNILHSILQKTYESVTAPRAKEIYPKALLIQKETDTIFKYIENLKGAVHQSEPTGIDLKTIKTFHSKLETYKRKVLSLDKRLSEELSGKLFTASQNIDSSGEILAMMKNYLFNKPVKNVEVYLSRVENNLAIDEQKAIDFLHYQIAAIIDDFTVFEAIVGQNTRILRVGETLEILAGLGRFSNRILPVISVGDSIVPLNEKGLAVYKLKTSTMAGSYSIPVTISFTESDGNVQTRTIPIEYKTISANLK